MPVTIVVGGQFGSEGKGKVAAIAVREQQAAAVVRIGGPNSGHTPDGLRLSPLRQLPASAYENNAVCVLPPGFYISPDLLLAEVELTGLAFGGLKIDPAAWVVTESDRNAEAEMGLVGRIGSTGSGTGAAVSRRVMRCSETTVAGNIPALAPYLADTTSYLRGLLNQGRRVVIEGSQGFGLSVLHGGHYPYATSRDTTAAGALSETGLSPLDVDDVIVVIRAFPIRVSGDSGPLPDEKTWKELTRRGGHDHDLLETTTVTRQVRRVAQFDPDIVVRAVAANRPTTLVMNHLDYLDHISCLTAMPTTATMAFVEEVEIAIGRPVDRLGLGPVTLVDRSVQAVSMPAAADGLVVGTS